MAEVNGEMGQELLHLSSLAMPEGEPVDGKGVTEGMQGWSALAGHGLDAGEAEQPDKCQSLGVIVEPSSLAVDEERLNLPAAKYLRPCSDRCADALLSMDGERHSATCRTCSRE